MRECQVFPPSPILPLTPSPPLKLCFRQTNIMKLNWTSLLPFALLFCSFRPLPAQHFLEGHWEGSITFGGIYSEQSYPFELFLTVKGGVKVEGRSFVYLGPDNVIEMKVRGYIYNDRSVALVESEFMPREGKENEPPFFRKYQFVYSRGFWDTGIDGYWQQITPEVMDDNREMGRIKLNKAKSKKA